MSTREGPEDDVSVENDAGDAFWAKHEATPGAIIVVEVFRDDIRAEVGVFSTHAAGMTWFGSLPGVHDNDRCEAMFVPYIVDVPEFGESKRTAN